MKISKLIYELEEIRSEEGDIVVYIEVGGTVLCDFEIVIVPDELPDITGRKGCQKGSTTI